MEMPTLVDLIKEEALNAVVDPWNDYLSNFTPGLLLQSAATVLLVIGGATIDLFGNLARAFQRLPVIVAARILAQKTVKAAPTRAVRLDLAQAFAIDQAIGAIYELTGRGTTTNQELAKKVGHYKGLRKRLIALEERQILGRIGSKVFAILRAPFKFFYQLVLAVWNLAVIIAAIGGVIVLWGLIKADWSSVAFSQKHPRHWEKVRINRRL